MPSIQKSALKHALFWSFCSRYGQQVVRLAIGIVVARILEPEDFGLIGMLAIFTAFSDKLLTSSFGSAIIQKKDLDDLDTSTLFFFNIGFSLFLYALLFLAAPHIALFYDQSILSLILRISALKLVINSCCVVQNMLCSKELDFKTQMVVSMIGVGVSGLVGITMALKGFGVWSLVFQTLAGRSTVCAAYWFFHRWRPSWRFSLERLRRLLGYGIKVTGLALVEAVFRNLQEVIIGKVYQAAALGFYARGKALMRIPVSNIYVPLNAVVFPTFSKMQDEPDAMRRVYRKGNLYSCYLLFPAMAGMALVAEPLVEVLLTKKWLPCVPYLQLFCVIGAILPIRHLNSYLFKAVDRVGLALKLQVAARLVSVALLIVTCTISIEAILIGEIFSTIILVGIFTYFGGRLIQYPVRKQLLDMLPYGLITLAMAACVYSIRLLEVQNPFFLLGLQIGTGILIYGILSHLFRFDPYLEICKTATGLAGRFRP